MNTQHAERAVISLAGKEIEVFMMPDGSYKYSATSAAKALGKLPQDFHNYLASPIYKGSTPSGLSDFMALKALESFEDKGSTPSGLSDFVKVGKTRIKVLNDLTVIDYWSWKAENGSQEAKALTQALVAEALTRRADAAFGVKKTEEAYEEQTKQVRLHLVKKFAETYELDKTSFYKSLEAGEFTEEEKEYSLNMVSLKRLYKFMENQDYLCYRDSEGRRLDTLSDIEDLESRLANLK